MHAAVRMSQALDFTVLRGRLKRLAVVLAQKRILRIASGVKARMG